MYKPNPIETSEITLCNELLELTDLNTKNVHNYGTAERINEGWKYGGKSSEKIESPLLLTYEDNLFLSGNRATHYTTLIEGDFIFLISEDNKAYFDWFSNSVDGTPVVIPEVLEIPEQVGNGLPVVGFYSSGHDDYEQIRKVILPKSISSFDKNPLDCCPNLEEIAVSSDHPSLVVENGLLIDREKGSVLCCPVGKAADVIHVSDWIHSIGDYAFSCCGQMLSIDLPNSITEIGEGAFYQCARLEQIVIPSGVREISGFTFNGCYALKKIVLPEGILRIGSFAFGFCAGLSEIELPDSVESFDFFAFAECENLTKINLPLYLKEIDPPPFYHCSRLKEVIIPSGQEKYRLEGSLLIDRERLEVVCCLAGFHLKEIAVPV